MSRAKKEVSSCKVVRNCLCHHLRITYAATVPAYAWGFQYFAYGPACADLHISRFCLHAHSYDHLPSYHIFSRGTQRLGGNHYHPSLCQQNRHHSMSSLPKFVLSALEDLVSISFLNVWQHFTCDDLDFHHCMATFHEDLYHHFWSPPKSCDLMLHTSNTTVHLTKWCQGHLNILMGRDWATGRFGLQVVEYKQCQKEYVRVKDDATPASGGLATGNDKPIHVSFALEFFKDIAMKHFSG